MTIERQLQLFYSMLVWASEMYDDFELYEWCRNRGMTDEEIDRVFCCFDENQFAEYHAKYDEFYNN